MKNIQVMNAYEEWEKPFEKIVTRKSTPCRFCEEEASHRLYQIKLREGLDFNPYIDHGIESKKIQKGESALRVILHAGPSGNVTICMECAKLLLNNLEQEMECRN